jgi:outer membrane protein assembly factor BamB
MRNKRPDGPAGTVRPFGAVLPLLLAILVWSFAPKAVTAGPSPPAHGARPAPQGPSSAYQVNWPKYHMDLANTGYNPYETQIGVDNISTLAVAWTFRAGAAWGTPALWRGTIYATGNTSHGVTVLSALDATTGSVTWTEKIPHSYGPGKGVAYYRGALYLGTDDYVFRSLDARTGKAKWKVFLGGIPGDVVMSGGVVYVASSSSGTVYALDAATGAQVWVSSPFGGLSLAAPALSNGVLYIGGYDAKVHALDAATGETLWTFQVAQTIYASPAVANGLVYVTQDDLDIYALDAATGALVWQQPLGTFGSASSPAVANGVVYASGDGMMQAFDSLDGTPLWATPIAEITGAPVLANGVLYVPGGSEDILYALDAATGAKLWSFRAAKTFIDPIVANGRVYAGCQDGNLYAFSLPG